VLDGRERLGLQLTLGVEEELFDFTVFSQGLLGEGGATVRAERVFGKESGEGVEEFLFDKGMASDFGGEAIKEGEKVIVTGEGGDVKGGGLLLEELDEFRVEIIDHAVFADNQLDEIFTG
jgi:hypothetical protein